MSYNVIIRSATTADVYFVSKCWRDMIKNGHLLGVDQKMPIEEVIDRVISNPFQIVHSTLKRRIEFYIVCVENEAIGFCETWTHMNEAVAEFHKVYVVPEWRRQSIASQTCIALMRELQHADSTKTFFLRILSNLGQKHDEKYGAALAKSLNMTIHGPVEKYIEKQNVCVTSYFVNI